MIKTYQIIHSDLDLHPEMFFTPAHDTMKRGHKWKLSKQHAQSKVRRQSFSMRVVKDWNALPAEVVSTPSLKQFKAWLDGHWANIPD